jgi:hypothetical protein
MKMTTSAAATVNTRVFVFVVWTNASRVLNSVTGGGLTWTIDRQVKNAANYHVAMASAYAPSGLPTKTAITATFSGSVNHGDMAAVSFSGIAPNSAVDAAATSVDSGFAGWSATTTTTNANDLVLGFSTVDAVTTNTPTAPNIEIHDINNVNFYSSAASEYQIVSTAGAKTVSGTWANAAGAIGNATVVVAYKGS